MDVIATAADLGGSSLPTDRIYDGKSIKSVLLEGAESPHPAFFYYCKDNLMAVRVGQYKAHFKTQRVRSQHEYGEECRSGFPLEDYFDCNECEGDCVTEHDPPLLFNLFKDPGEAYPLEACGHEDVFLTIKSTVAAHKAALVKGESLLDTFDHSIVPCCNPDTGCVCNYVHEPGMPECYQDLVNIAARHYTP